MGSKSVQAIIDSHINGQGKQMVEQIDEHGLYTFWEDLRFHLQSFEYMPSRRYQIFTEIVIKYHRIKNR